MAAATDRSIVLGRIVGLFGLRGELKVQSYTEPPEGICSYRPWLLVRNGKVTETTIATGRAHGRGVVVTFTGIVDRDAAQELVGTDISVRRDQLPRADVGEHYWADLEGLRVETLEGIVLGEVSHLFETGANDVLVVRGDRERLIPYIPAVIHTVDTAAGVLRVDWDPEF